ncbi:MAG TPA: DUF2066 domain-containing protein [Rhizomicrobium sp.]|jgi:hypothetical protein|nr:DUF2066 domain-containing protein [Rhizomicrobium sp.]
MRQLLSVCIILLGLAFAVPHAGAADDPFTVSGIKVDATAPSAVDAQTKAIESGRDRAWQTLYRRLTRQEDWAHQPALDPVALRRLIRSYQVHDARSSTTRFVASMTYVFNASAVRRLLQQADIAYSDVTAKPVLIIPLGPGWSAQSPWTRAWADARFARGAIPLVLPTDDAINSSALGGIRFDRTAWQDVEPMASRVRASEAWLVLVIPQRAQMMVKVRRLGPGSSPSVPDVVVPVPPGTPPAKSFARVADATADAIQEFWKSRSAVDFGKHSRVVAALHIDSLTEWGDMLQKLGAVPTISDVNMLAMDIGEAKIEIAYAGSADQLNQQLSRQGLTLANEGGQWWLESSHTETGSR